MAKIKVLHIITGLTLGGAEKFLHTLVTGPLYETCENHIISLAGPDHFGESLMKNGINLTCLNMRPGRTTPTEFRALKRVVKNLSPDIIQGWMYHGNLAATLAAKMATNNPALVWNIRQSLYNFHAEKLSTQCVIRGNKWLSGRPDCILYNSEVAHQQHQNFGFNFASSKVIYNGINTDLWQPNNEYKSALRNRLGTPKNSQLIGYVARFHPMKDVPNFLSALRIMMANNPDVHCVMIGRNLGPDNAALTHHFAQLPIQRIHIVGQHNDLTSFLPALDALCISSLRGESFPNVLGEAMACGVPCVATNVGDAHHIIGDTGIIVPPSDPQKLAQACQNILQNPEKYTGTRARIIENFSLPKATNSYANLYQSLAERVLVR